VSAIFLLLVEGNLKVVSSGTVCIHFVIQELKEGPEWGGGGASDITPHTTILYSYFLPQGTESTRWFKYDRDYLCVNKSQFVLVIFEPRCMSVILLTI
jgi:hypothetical protein